MDNDARRAARIRAVIAFVVAGVLVVGSLVAVAVIAEERDDDRDRIDHIDDERGPFSEHDDDDDGDHLGTPIDPDDKGPDRPRDPQRSPRAPGSSRDRTGPDTD